MRVLLPPHRAAYWQGPRSIDGIRGIHASSGHRPSPPCVAQDSEPVTALALSPDGRLLFAASRSLQLRCWSLDSGEVLRSYKGHRAPIADIAVDATGALLATSSADRAVKVWDVDGGFCTHSFSGHRCGRSPRTVADALC